TVPTGSGGPVIATPARAAAAMSSTTPGGGTTSVTGMTSEPTTGTAEVGATSGIGGSVATGMTPTIGAAITVGGAPSAGGGTAGGGVSSRALPIGAGAISPISGLAVTGATLGSTTAGASGGATAGSPPPQPAVGIVRLRDVARVELGDQNYSLGCTFDGHPS